jgi:NAD dependent epimerase/dehydratase family enzyme
VLRRPAVLPAPAFALRVLLGEMADPLMLTGARVMPAKAQATGFTFAFPQLESALRDLYQS